jgi:hypothetical protein
MCYEEIDEQVEYLDVSSKGLKFNGILEILLDLIDDDLIKQVNLSYNVPLDEVQNPANIEKFLPKFKSYLARNKSLIAIDLAGNNLFHYHPHPSNEHTKNYEVEFTKALRNTRITHIDLSENNITGFKGRELYGFVYFLKNFMLKRKALICRRNLLNSQGFLSLVHCLGITSTLTYLDVSDNFGGIDPLGRQSSEGIACFARALSQTPFLRTLKIARNLLRDNDIDSISEAIHHIAGFQDLDISGNLLSHLCCRHLQQAICSHSITSYSLMDKTKHIGGFRELSMNNNHQMGDEGLMELCIALTRNKTLQGLYLQYCNIHDVGGRQLWNALQLNSTLINVDIENNPLSEELQIEIEVNNHYNHCHIQCSILYSFLSTPLLLYYHLFI